MDPIGQLKQIKDIIFGPEMDDLLGRIERLEEKLASQEKHVEEGMEHLKLDMGKDLEAARNSLEARIEKVIERIDKKTEQLDQAQVKRKELGKLLVNLGEKFLKE